MLAWMGLAIAASADGRLKVDMGHVPVNYRLVGGADVRIPISDSVRAATWDVLSAKVDKPTHVRLACIVLRINGAPGACIPEAMLPPGQTTVDWTKLRADDRAASAGNPAGLDLADVANERITTSLLTTHPSPDNMVEVRIFDEVVSPEDARAPFAPAGDALNWSEVTLARPLDGSLLADLYPPAALRANVEARVTIVCHIQPSRRLLCRDPGAFQILKSDQSPPAPYVLHTLLNASYQMASTILLEPTTGDGCDVIGRDLKVALRWQIPKD